jgi:hypothetical protein
VKILKDVVGPLLIVVVLLLMYGWASSHIAADPTTPTQGQP